MTDFHAIIETAFAGDVTLRGHQTVHGGDAHNSEYAELSDERRVCIKTNDARFAPHFSAEVDGLNALRHNPHLLCATPLAHGVCDTTAYAIIEWIDSDDQSADEAFGESLALMHDHLTGDRFGFTSDNFIGPTAQHNAWKNDWVSFYAENRLVPQAELAANNNHTDIASATFNLAQRLGDLLPSRPRPALIHGDLWAGNFLTRDDGNTVLIDPAVYYADREAEFGIITLFGGFSQEFYDGYTSVEPFDDGFDERLPIYQLYHYLNHLHLFGEQYAPACRAILDSYS